MHIQAKEFGICGTKDKRAVTTQRVSIKRNGRTLENFWKNCNDIRSKADELRATTQRALRGVRVGDIAYADQHLDLGMLKGNKFVIVLRYVPLAKSFHPFDNRPVMLISWTIRHWIWQ